MKLDIRALAIALGGLWGGCVFLLAALGSFFPGYADGFLSVVASVYPGFHPGGMGAAVIGGLYGAVDGAVAGAIIAWLYNRVSRSTGTA